MKKHLWSCVKKLIRLNTLNMKSHYLLFGEGSFYPLRVAKDVKTFFYSSIQNSLKFNPSWMGLGLHSNWKAMPLDWTRMKPGSTVYSVPCLATKIFLDTTRLLGARNLSKRFDLGRPPLIGQMGVISNSKKNIWKINWGLFHISVGIDL